MTRSLFFAAVCGMATLIALSAHAGNQSRAQAFPVGDNLIEVIADFSENSIYWCGAAEYVITTGTNRTNRKIYVWQGPGPSSAKPGEQAVQFGFRPPPGANTGTGLTNDVATIGNSMSFAQARQTCNERTTSG